MNIFCKLVYSCCWICNVPSLSALKLWKCYFRSRKGDADVSMKMLYIQFRQWRDNGNVKLWKCIVFDIITFTDLGTDLCVYYLFWKLYLKGLIKPQVLVENVKKRSHLNFVLTDRRNTWKKLKLELISKSTVYYFLFNALKSKNKFSKHTI